MKLSTTLRYRHSALFLAGAALVSAAALTPAHAGELAPSGARSAKQQPDSDRSGRVSRTEAQRDPLERQRANVLDANRDGVLDAAELAAPNNKAAVRGTEVKQ